MTRLGPTHQTANLARARLPGDQAARPVNEQRAELNILAQRLDRAARTLVTQDLVVRIRSDQRFAPLLGRLFQMSLDA